MCIYIQGKKTIYAIFTRSFYATCACIKLYSEGNLIADCSKNLTRGFFTYIIQGCVEMIVCIDNLHALVVSQSIEELGPCFVPSPGFLQSCQYFVVC